MVEIRMAILVFKETDFAGDKLVNFAGIVTCKAIDDA